MHFTAFRFGGDITVAKSQVGDNERCKISCHILLGRVSQPGKSIFLFFCEGFSEEIKQSQRSKKHQPILSLLKKCVRFFGRALIRD